MVNSNPAENITVDERQATGAEAAAVPVPEIISREEAKAMGLNRFFSGEPCAKGHVAERYVIGGCCVECQAKHTAAWRALNQDDRVQIRAQRRARKAANLKRASAWRSANPEKSRAQSRRSSATRDSFAKRADAINWRAKRRRIIGFLTPDNIRTAYYAHVDASGAPLCGNRYLPCPNDLRAGFHVDHINPWDRGGDNTPANIQCLCPSCNTMKGTKTEEEFKAHIDQDRDRIRAARAKKQETAVRVVLDNETTLRLVLARLGLKPRRRRAAPANDQQMELFHHAA